MNDKKILESQSIRQILMKKDEVTLVDSDGKLLGRADKFEAHKHPAKLHLAISVWLINNKGEILLQKRSKKKIVGADWWANTVCGNVWPTETFFDCAHRRLRQEIGIVEAKIKPIYKFEYKAYCNETYGEHELDQVYIGSYDGEVVPNPDEVSEFAWVNLDKLISTFSVMNYISPEQTLLEKEQSLKDLTKPISITIDGKELLVAPWTILMLKDTRLAEAFA